MDWQLIWDYFGNFNDREFFRIVVIVMFVFGIPITVGLLAKVVAWSARQVADCRRALEHDSVPAVRP